MYYGNQYNNYGERSAYQPPYNNYQQQQPINGIVSVAGIEGAKQYQLPPGSRVTLFDQERDLFYLVTTDDAGYPSITTYQYEEVKQQEEPIQSFATKEDFNAITDKLNRIEEMLNNAQLNNAAVSYSV